MRHLRRIEAVTPASIRRTGLTSRCSAGTTTTELTRDGLPLTFIEATDTSDLVVGAMIYGSVRALQLVWPDPQGRFPWEPGCIMNHDQQPLRGRTSWPRPPD